MSFKVLEISVEQRDGSNPFMRKVMLVSIIMYKAKFDHAAYDRYFNRSNNLGHNRAKVRLALSIYSSSAAWVSFLHPYYPLHP